ncbi:MAG: peptidoglycan-binding protein [Proteobacteria bacterium]|nr:peptidoglycan-binding protein [Desulfocapsa sp.]MBU3944539.1 peptidoglycan-binding protein [Pseudomonadota bacterium]MCG2744126.1 peptidoglycan-binding protein [Desulfobacteraceae bacterium]MBU3982687.1 peptidoglycan-binding protein [Pseudomonadota bacterium]MBU4028128.1 peptidoglycan-binding protein [Pseudomonadota bacterium]
MTIAKFTLLGLTAIALLSSSCVETGMQMGSQSAKTVATGSAAGSSTSGESSALEKCAAPLGTISLIENQSAGWYTILTNEYHLPPTANLLRLLIQQSNCFVVVERSAAGMNAMSRERALQESGEMRQGSNFGKGQMVSSDYALSPEIVFSEDTGGMSGAVGSVLGGMIGGHAGALVSSAGVNTKTREASALLTMIDNRSSVQIAAAEGSASKTDIGGFGNLFGGAGGIAGGAGLSGYTNTPQGKVIAAAFMDAYNNIVRSLRNYKAQEVKGGLGKGGQLKVGN